MYPSVCFNKERERKRERYSDSENRYTYTYTSIYKHTYTAQRPSNRSSKMPLHNTTYLKQNNKQTNKTKH